MTDIWLARDLDGLLHSYPTEPYYVREWQHWQPDAKSQQFADPYRILPRDWFPEIEPGKCVRFERAKT